MYHFYMSDPITYYLIAADGTLKTIIMGSKPSQVQEMQLAEKA
jgi:predicted cupin superfamily sugar epimerase